jgi:hypothetical protein
MKEYYVMYERGREGLVAVAGPYTKSEAQTVARKHRKKYPEAEISISKSKGDGYVEHQESGRFR